MEGDGDSVDGDDETPFVDSNKEEFGLYRPPFRRGKWKSTKLCYVTVACIAAVLFVLTFGAGFLAGYFSQSSSHHSHADSGGHPASWGSQVNDDGDEVAVVDWLDGVLSNDSIRDKLRMITEKPHIAGGEQNAKLAFLLYQQWQAYGFDDVKLYNYSVLLSYPDKSNPNILQIRDPSGLVDYNAGIAEEPPLTSGENDSNVVPPFNAYSGVGNASGPLVYVNYARVDDFFYLTKDLGVNLSGRICVARYGNIFRGNKANLAQQFGCVALILYSDPADYAPRDELPDYPNGPSLPPGGVQRGSVMLPPGDPTTPGMPALDGIYHRPYQEAVDDQTVPSIPVQPVSYSVAFHFLSQMDKIKAPPDWVGELNLTYYLIQDTANTKSAYIEVNNIQEERTIYDVTATLYGRQQPDQMVIIGNHRDAWVFGAVDPSSATAILMEIAHGLGQLIKRDWRPGRTIVLCSWDAEEHGLIGSTEWVEDLGKVLDAQMVAYLNMDIGVSGPLAPRFGASPLLYQAIYLAAKLVDSPDPNFQTVFDQWIRYHNTTYNGTVLPEINDLGSGTDYTMFLQNYGIPCSDMRYEMRKNSTASYYEVYHSVHDNFYWMTHFGDPSFSHHLAIGLVWSKLAMILATTPVLPFDPRDYAWALSRIFNNLEKEYGDELASRNISLLYLRAELQDFNESASNLFWEIHSLKQESSSADDNVVRIINNKLMNLERSFIHPEGLPGRPWYKHVVFAPSSVNIYGSSVFPGVLDSIFDATNNGGSWDEVRKQIDIVRVHVHYATQVLSFPSLKYVM